MKKAILLLLLYTGALHSQPGIEVHLVDPMVGYPVATSGGFDSNWSNDEGLNAIFQTYGVSLYQSKAGHPLYGERVAQIWCGMNNIQLFINALQSYSAVIESAQIADACCFPGILLAELKDPEIGIPSGIVNNTVTTNDNGLNTIFQNFNVYAYELSVPSFSNKYYIVSCTCNNALLADALNNYTNVIQSTGNYTAAYLGVPESGLSTVKVYPNPFRAGFSIETKENIVLYAITDISGRQIVSTSSKAVLDNSAAMLQNGIYLLALQSDNGKTYTQKIVKN